MQVFSFILIPPNGCVYETFGISKHFPVKLQLLLTRDVLLDKPLTAKCFIHDVSVSCFILSVFCPFIFSLLSIFHFANYCVQCCFHFVNSIIKGFLFCVTFPYG